MSRTPGRRHVLVTGAAGFIGMHVAQRAARRRRRRHRRRQSRSVLRRRAEGGAARAPVRASGVRLRARRSRGRRGRRGALSRRRIHRRDPSRGAARRALFARRIPAPTSSTTSSRSVTCIEGCRHARIAHLVYASLVERLWREPHAAVLRGPERRSSGQPVRGDEEGERADRAQLQPSLRACRRRACASSPSTARGAAPTWRRCCSPRRFSRATPIRVFNDGRMRRDFTYIDDIVEGVVRVLERPPARDGDGAPLRDLQHRQPRGGRARDVHRDARPGCWAERRSRSTRRCSRATCRRPTRRSTGCPR